MSVRKGSVYLIVMGIVAGWFFLIIWLSYKDDRLFTPMSYNTFKRANPVDFDLYCQLNPRPGLPPPAPETAMALAAVLRNKDGTRIQTLLVPADEFSALRVQVFVLGKTVPTYEATLGDPQRGENDIDGRKNKLPSWHTLNIGPRQSIGKEIVLPNRAFPVEGDYRIVLHWNTDDRDRLEGRVAPIDRDSSLLDLQTEQVIRITRPTLPKPDPNKGPAESPLPKG